MERMGDLVTRYGAGEAEHPGGGTTDGGVGRASRRDSQLSMSCFDDAVLPQTAVHTRRGGRRPPRLASTNSEGTEIMGKKRQRKPVVKDDPASVQSSETIAEGVKEVAQGSGDAGLAGEATPTSRLLAA